MKKSISAALLVVFTATSVTFGQGAPASTGKTLAATMNVYVFPTKGQSASQQSEDEAACYTWAVQNVGTDPFQLQKQAQQQQQQTAAKQQQAAEAGKGAGAAGAVGGAAAGALIGGVSHGDVGQSAAIGAAVGLVAGRRKRKEAQAQGSQQAQQQGQQAQQATQAQLDDFKKAFSVCLEAKDYMVKF